MSGLDDTEQESESVNKHLGNLRERMSGAREREEETEVSVETPEPPEPDDETELPAGNRQHRRAERQSPRERLAAAEAREQVLREQLAERNRPAPGTRQEPTVVNTADVDKRIRTTYEELERLESEYLHAQQNKTLTPAREKEMRARAQELEIEKLELAAERREQRLAPTRRQEELTRQLARDNSDVYDDPRAARYAYGRAQQLIAMGRKDDKALHDEVMAETRSVVLKIREKPGAIDKQRAAGMSGGVRAEPSTTGRTVSMPKGSHYYRQAIALYPKLDPGAACQKWAQTVGKKLLAKG